MCDKIEQTERGASGQLANNRVGWWGVPGGRCHRRLAQQGHGGPPPAGSPPAGGRAAWAPAEGSPPPSWPPHLLCQTAMDGWPGGLEKKIGKKNTGDD